MAVYIDQHLHLEVSDFIRELYGSKKRVYSKFKKGTWQSSRYIQISTCIKMRDLHYEYYNGSVQLHFEGVFLRDEYESFRNYLKGKTNGNNCLIWAKWQNHEESACRLEDPIDTLEDLQNAIKKIIEIFDPLIEDFSHLHPELFERQKSNVIYFDRSYHLQDTTTYAPPSLGISKVGELPFDEFIIPSYQRPYKWTAKNVNQLISDIIAFRKQQQYRLGTLVLHNNEIVDGQQRIITLLLLIRIMCESIQDDKVKNNYADICNRINYFANTVSFSNKYTLHNIVENIRTIESRKTDFDQTLLDFLLNKCEFVVVRLHSISEAFQFFDSQNARGKDLAAHDLLKAYHLREIPNLNENDSHNIDEWQNKSTDVLKDVFLTLFRAKRWSLGESARSFKKSNIDIFKGVSLNDAKCYPFYQMEIIAHIFSEIYNNDPTRIIDKNHIEYPFNLDDQIINGSRFFDMICHYMKLYIRIQNYGNILPKGQAKSIFELISDYDGAWRTGDGYVRSMFYTLILYYVDRFGEEELDRVVPQIFIWAYTLRLEYSAIQLASVDNYASNWNSLFRIVHIAKSPYDIININLEGVISKKCSGCDAIIKQFKFYNKYYGND